MLRRILDVIFPLREHERLVREVTWRQVNTMMAPTTSAPLGISIISLFPYHTPLAQALIQEAKFEQNARAQEILGMVLARFLEDHIKVYAKDRHGLVPWHQAVPTLILVPIPLGSKRRAERGYNQTEQIGYWASQYCSFATLAPELLVRTRETAPQTSLGREARLLNMRGAFAPRMGFVPDPSCIYVLVDDVLTTGATVTAAAQALDACGVERLFVITLAH